MPLLMNDGPGEVPRIDVHDRGTPSWRPPGDPFQEQVEEVVAKPVCLRRIEQPAEERRVPDFLPDPSHGDKRVEGVEDGLKAFEFDVVIDELFQRDTG